MRGNPIKYTDPTGKACYWNQGNGDYVCVNDTTGDVSAQGTGYSGHGEGVNNSGTQGTPSVGPIPQGDWTTGIPQDRDHTGPVSIPLFPDVNNDIWGTGRDNTTFFVHGDNGKNNNSASEGCPIIPPRKDRQSIPPGEKFIVY